MVYDSLAIMRWPAWRLRCEPIVAAKVALVVRRGNVAANGPLQHRHININTSESNS